MLRDRTPDGFNILGDSAFPNQGEFKTKMRVCKKQDSFERECKGKSKAEIAGLLLEHKHITSIRQASEWGMHQLQGCFARLKLRLPSTRERRAKIIRLCVMLHNLRVRRVGISQILTVFSPNWVPKIIQGCEIDRISSYYRLVA